MKYSRTLLKLLVAALLLFAYKPLNTTTLQADFESLPSLLPHLTCGDTITISKFSANVADLPSRIILQDLDGDRIPELRAEHQDGRVSWWNLDGSPLNHDPSVLLRTQDLPPVYEENSCIYIFQRSIFLERENRLGCTPFMFEIDGEEAWDIDEELGFLIVDRLMQERMRTESETHR